MRAIFMRIYHISSTLTADQSQGKSVHSVAILEPPGSYFGQDQVLTTWMGKAWKLKNGLPHLHLKSIFQASESNMKCFSLCSIALKRLISQPMHMCSPKCGQIFILWQIMSSDAMTLSISNWLLHLEGETFHHIVHCTFSH